jgi:hypothetical protein
VLILLIFSNEDVLEVVAETVYVYQPFYHTFQFKGRYKIGKSRAIAYWVKEGKIILHRSKLKRFRATF